LETTAQSKAELTVEKLSQRLPPYQPKNTQNSNQADELLKNLVNPIGMFQ
jgi:hypothetical protein